MGADLELACIVLLILTPLSYLPINRNVAAMLVIPPTNGISISAALLLALCAQSQVVNMYYLWVCPPFKRWGMVVPKPPRRIDYINLAQITTQWICAVGYLLFLLDMRPREHPSMPLDPDNDREAWLLSLVKTSTPPPSPNMAYVLLVLHAAFCVFWDYLGGTPQRDWIDLPYVMVTGLHACIINPVVSLIYVYAIKLQINTTVDAQGVSVLTRSAVGFQALVFLALAVTWPWRFKVPLNLSRGRDGWWWVTEWYPLVGWAAVNSGMIGIGLGVVALLAGSME